MFTWTDAIFITVGTRMVFFFNYVALDLRYVCENNSPGNINHQEKDKRDDGFAPEL